MTSIQFIRKVAVFDSLRSLNDGIKTWVILYIILMEAFPRQYFIERFLGADFFTKEHPFITYAKFSSKPIFFTPLIRTRTTTKCFTKKIAYVRNG